MVTKKPAKKESVKSSIDSAQNKQEEHVLREGGAYMNALLENAPEGVYIYDLAGNFLYGNHRCEEIIGYGREEILGRNYLEVNILSESSVARAIEIFQDNAKGKSSGPDEFELIRKDGRRVPVEISTSVVQWEGEKFVLAFVRDISIRKNVESALVESEARYRLLSEHMADGVTLMDMDLKPIYVSPSIEKMRGFTPLEAFNMPLEKHMPPESLKLTSELFLEELPRVAANPAYNPVRTLELEYYCKDGSTIWTESKFSIIRDPSGKPVSVLGEVWDITQRKRVEAALKEREEQYRLLSEHTTDFIWLMDMDLKPTYQSPSAEKLTGFTQQELTELPFEKRITPESLKSAAEVFFKQIPIVESDPDYNPVITLELEVYRKDGTTIWSENKFSVIRDDNGRPVSILGEARDISERKKTEDALREREAQYRLLSEHTTDSVWLMDMNLKTTYHSASIEKIRGFTAQEIMDLPLEQNLTPESLKSAYEMFLTELPRIEADPDYNPVRTLELEYYCKDGTTAWAENKFSVIRDPSGKLVSILGEARDISDRKRIEYSLRESEEKYRMVVENARESIFIVVDGMLKFANKRASMFSGYSEEELTSKSFFEFIHPDDRPRATERYLQRLKGIEVPDKFTFRVVFKAGDIRWVELTSVQITWEGKPAAMHFMTDITDRMHLEKEQQRASKLESLAVLAGGIAHDFNNILTAVMGNVSLAGMEVRAGSEVHERLEEAQKALLRAKDLTGQLLTFSRGGAPVKKLSSLDELLRDTARFALHGSNVKCHFSMVPHLWHAEIDAGQISQVVHNLVINAQQAMPTGGTIELVAENMVLSETQSLGRGLPLKEGNYIRIAVTDHGSGISAEHLDRIFDPFFTTKQRGSGLGLATSFSIARNHGGHLSVESVLGSGATFYLYLPASMATSAPKQDQKEEIKPAGKARILVMDDEKEVREVTGHILKRIGYNDIKFAANGAETVKLYKAALESGRPFTVVILDLTIPGGMGGEETIKALLKIDPGVKAIVASGYADEAIMADYRGHGFSGMVAKPYTIEELQRAVQDVIG
ncbi:MAG: PAS domain S-box protein [Dehalococcoidia bacterium]|nr:PAS domain S-box protein [Dehalococcoidia bacterium]MDD5493447.1 PAS domain S-box protein [Dehalococcoidia bacterium]